MLTLMLIKVLVLRSDVRNHIVKDDNYANIAKYANAPKSASIMLNILSLENDAKNVN